MNLNKSKHFTPKKEDSFLLSLFLSTCFSFQTMADLVQVKFYYQQFDVFRKLFENLQENDCDRNHF